MSQRKFIDVLAEVATKENVQKAVTLAGIGSPWATLVVGVVGAVVTKAASAAKSYIVEIDKIPLVPPLLPHKLTYNESIAFFESKGLTDNFADEIANSDPTTNPSEWNYHEGKILIAASFLRQAVDKNDPIFNGFFYDKINSADPDLMGIYGMMNQFIIYREQLQIAIPQAKFATMGEYIRNQIQSNATWDVIKSDLTTELKTYLSDIADSTTVENVLELVGL